MSVRRGGAIGVVAVALLLAGAAGAGAGPPGKWTRVTSEPQPANTREIGLERTADGTLHVLWTRDAGATEQVMHRSLAGNAKSLSSSNQLISTPNFVNDSVDLIATPAGGLRAFFAGVFPAAPLPGGYSSVMATAISTTGGATWTAATAASRNAPPGNSAVSAASGIGAALVGANPISAWGDSGPSEAGFHVGVDPAANDISLGGACCEVDPNLAVDSQSGVFGLAYNDLTGAETVLRVTLPLISTDVAPGSRATWVGQRVGLTGRIGAAGIYAAYGFGKNRFDARPALWRVGAAKAKVLKTPRDAEHTTLSPAPDGRLWVAWEGADRGKRLFATRTSPSAKRFGSIVAVKPPKGTSVIHRLNVEGSRGPLDLLALVQRGGDDISYWHQRIVPGLTLAANPAKVVAGKAITFKATDAGAAVKQAKVTLKVAGKHVAGSTKANGTVTLKVPKGAKPGRYRATARKGGYSPGKRRVRVGR